MKKLLLSLSFIVYCLSFINAQTINTYAGDGYGATATGGFSGDGGLAINAELYWPTSIAIDNAGNLYFADSFNMRIRKISPAATISTFAGNGSGGYAGDGGPATAASFFVPSQISLDVLGNMYVSDNDNYRIRKINTSGIVSTVAGNGIAGYSGDGAQASAAEIHGAGNVIADNHGNLYFADGFNNCVRMINTSGVITTVIGNGTAGFSGDGAQASAAELHYPGSILFDASGNMYITDGFNNRVRMVNTSGIITTVAGNGTGTSSGDGGPATAASLNYPSGILMDNWSHLYISESMGGRIRRINNGDTIYTLAGLGTGFAGDGGLATAARLYNPAGMALDASGNVYVADMQNDRIRIISGGILSTPELVNRNLVAIYPNPNNGVFTIESLVVSHQSSVVEVYNMLGEKVYSQTLNIEHSTFNIDLSGQPNGIYLLRVQNEDGSILTKKIEIVR